MTEENYEPTLDLEEEVVDSDTEEQEDVEVVSDDDVEIVTEVRRGRTRRRYTSEEDDTETVESNEEDTEVTSLATYTEEEEAFDLEQKIYHTYTVLRHLSPSGTAIGAQYCFMDYLGAGRIALYNRSNFPHNSVECIICPSAPQELSFLGLEQMNKLMNAHCVILRDASVKSALYNNGFLDTLPEVPFIYIKNDGEVYLNHKTVEILSEITYRDTVGQEVLASMSKTAMFTFSSPNTIIYVLGSGLVQDVATVTPYNGEQMNMDGYTYYLMKNHLKACLTSRHNFFHTFSSLPIYEEGSMGLTIGGMETAEENSKKLLDIMLKK